MCLAALLGILVVTLVMVQLMRIKLTVVDSMDFQTCQSLVKLSPFNSQISPSSA